MEPGTRLVLLSDLHIGIFIGAGYLERVAAAVNRLEPELPPGLREEIPPGLPPALFLGTAWEAGLRRFPLEPVLRECRIGGRRAGMEDAAALILLGRRETEEEKGGTPGKNGGTEPALLP